ncbi:arginase family protein [Chitinophaga sp. Cy-1792]|uniref:arginase family protein n=1 Tax=Chitinophaga sp. Cy-1792 TaxID=2608339 RepID=UPI00141F05C4|nr:arginase family protein [Chitinophaga sp. Cy-1792]NIG55633.1 arginase family protein [Chitinophaga sp. Cy-1792]
MKHSSDTLRLVYPQWQGGVINSLLPELDPDDAATGYFLGAQLLSFLAPDNGQRTVEVPVSMDVSDRKTENGINSRAVIIKQIKAALEILLEENPSGIVTLGGDCAVSAVPFSYLGKKYADDVAIVWIDAHPDINLPGDPYTGFHAMVLSALLGLGDDSIVGLLPAHFKPEHTLIVGLRSWDHPGIKERQEELGIKGLAPAAVAGSSAPVLDWLKATGKSKVLIHFDLDVLDPKEIIAAVGTDPEGLKINEVIRIIRDIAAAYDVVGLTVAEHMPRVAIKLRNILRQLPLLNDEVDSE